MRRACIAVLAFALMAAGPAPAGRAHGRKIHNTRCRHLVRHDAKREGDPSIDFRCVAA
jgi:hypothetical protein